MYVPKPICSTSYPQTTEKEPVKRKASQTSPIPPKRIKLANGNNSSADPAPDSDGVKSIFVGRLSWNVDDDWLAQEFAECSEASVQMDRNTGKSRGFGYVHFATGEVVEAALALNGKKIDGRTVNVDKSNPLDNSHRENRSKAVGDETGPPSNTLWELVGEYGAVKRQEELAGHVEDLVEEVQRERAESALREAEKDREVILRRERRVLEAIQSTVQTLKAESKKAGESHTTARLSLQLEADRLKRDPEN
jgi:RNA recognition motif-containing protein